jgi:hypothetical protein
MSFQTLYRSSPPELKQIIIDQWKAKQNPKWHPEGNTLKHIIVVTNRAFKNFPDNRDIQLAAYFHDLGKLATYEINPKSGQPTAYGHEKESVDLIDEFSNFVEQQGANPKIVKYIVQNHMKIKPSTWDIMKLSKKDPILNDPNYQDLEKFSTIDKGGLLELQYLLQNKKTNKMANQILSEEFRRMQKLAGIITESQLNEEENISQEIQALIDKNDFLKGKVTAAPSDIIEGNKFVLLFSEDSSKHIAERHLDGTKPGSLFKSGVNLRDVAKKLLNTPPSEESGGRIKWLGVNGGNVGEMGVAKSSPEEVAKMKEYTMPDGGKEQVKIASGKRKPTNEVSLITAELGTLGNGKKALSIITMFPGGMKVDGEEIPMNRGEFAAKGLYFIVDPSSPLLKESVNEALRRYRRMLNEELTISNDNYELPDFEEKKKQLNTLFPDGSIDRSNWKMFGSDSEEDFENSIEYGEIDSQRILGVIEAEIEDLFPGFEVSCIMYSGDEKANIMVKKGNDSLSFDLKVDVL